MKILVLNGPNLNMLGKRERAHYGGCTLGEIEKKIAAKAKSLKTAVECFQSNHEGVLVEKIQKSSGFDGIIINAGAYTHTSVAIRDALITAGKPVVEVHLSNIYSREEFRQISYISDIAVGVIAGFRENSYILALSALCEHLRNA